MDKLIKNAIVELTIDNLGIFGEGISHTYEKTIFVKNALVGERVKAKIIFAKPTFCNAIIMENLDVSGDRVSPPCPYFGKCGGCQLQHLSYEKQLVYKQNTVRETLLKVAKLDAEVMPTEPSLNCYRYRNKLSLPIRNSGDKGFEIGFFAENSHRIVSIKDCLLQPEWAAKLIEIVSGFMTDNFLGGYDESIGRGDVRHLVVRQLCGLLHIVIVTNRRSLPQIKALNEILNRHYGNAYALYTNFNNQTNNVILGKEFEFVGGNEEDIVIDGLKMNVHPASFFQVNDYIRNIIYSHIEKGISEIYGGQKIRILDAYSGAGLLTAKMCDYADKVYGIEINGQAVAAADRLKKVNGIENMINVCGDCSEQIQKLENLYKCKVAVLDPPRAGCDEKVLTSIIEAGIDNIFYISCNPATLARDLIKLADNYTIKSIQPFDMFPQTVHVECVVCLTRKNV